MPTLETKADIVNLIKNPIFLDLLDINSPAEFSARRYAWPNSQYEYYADPDSDVTSGVHLFSTPSRGNNCGEGYGTWLNVVKLYGNPDLAYRVLGTDHTPDGNDHNETMIVGDFRSLIEALDMAFNAHELRTIHVQDLDEFPNKTPSPEEVKLSETIAESMANREIEKTLKEQHEKAKLQRYWADIKPTNIKAILSTAKSNGLALQTGLNVEWAVAMNKHLLNNKGELFGCFNDTIDGFGDLTGLAVVGVVNKQGDLEYYDFDGVTKTEAQVKLSMAEHYKKLLYSDYEGMAFTVNEGDEWEWDVDLLEIKFSKLDAQDIKTYLSIEDDTQSRPAHKTIGEATNLYRVKREHAHQASLAYEGQQEKLM